MKTIVAIIACASLTSCASSAPDLFDLELTKSMQQCLQKIQEEDQ